MMVLIWCIHRWLVTFLYRRYAVFPAAMAAKAVARPAMDSGCWLMLPGLHEKHSKLPNQYLRHCLFLLLIESTLE